jgi:acyl-CoA thioester hydrolase
MVQKHNQQRQRSKNAEYFAGRALQIRIFVLFLAAEFRFRYEMNFPKRTTVQSHTIELAGRYAETDQGGVIHHSVYPVWFEMGRTELLRANGLAYKDLESAGVFFVVAELCIKYRRPATYDEKLRLETSCTKVTAGKVEHSYKLSRNSNGEILAEGSSILACVDSEGRVRRVPEFMYPEA